MSYRDEPAPGAGASPESTGGAPASPDVHDPAVHDGETSVRQRPSDAESSATAGAPTKNMLPGRRRRRFGIERLLMRVIATAGIVGIGVLIAAIMASSKTQGWIIGAVVGGVSVILSAILWSSREL